MYNGNIFRLTGEDGGFTQWLNSEPKSLIFNENNQDPDNNYILSDGGKHIVIGSSDNIFKNNSTESSINPCTTTTWSNYDTDQFTYHNREFAGQYGDRLYTTYDFYLSKPKFGKYWALRNRDNNDRTILTCDPPCVNPGLSWNPIVSNVQVDDDMRFKFLVLA